MYILYTYRVGLSENGVHIFPQDYHLPVLNGNLGVPFLKNTRCVLYLLYIYIYTYNIYTYIYISCIYIYMYVYVYIHSIYIYTQYIYMHVIYIYIYMDTEMTASQSTKPAR